MLLISIFEISSRVIVFVLLLRLAVIARLFIRCQPISTNVNKNTNFNVNTNFGTKVMSSAKMKTLS